MFKGGIVGAGRRCLALHAYRFLRFCAQHRLLSLVVLSGMAITMCMFSRQWFERLLSRRERQARGCQEPTPPQEQGVYRATMYSGDNQNSEVSDGDILASYRLNLAAFSDNSSFASREQAFADACALAETANQQGLWSSEDQLELCGGCMLLANYFMARDPLRKAGDWGTKQSEAFLDRPDCDPMDVWCSIRTYYKSAHASKCCVTLLHNGVIPSDFIAKYATKRFRFLKVNVTKHSSRFRRRFTPNDERYFNVHEAFCSHRGWERVFFSDIFDVKIGSSPCSKAKAGTLYVGVDQSSISDPWLGRRFTAMGQEYLRFYSELLLNESAARRPMWSAGIIGSGDRATLSAFWLKLLAVLTDPNFAVLHSSTPVQGVNMGAVNYVVEKFFAGRAQGDAPLNSRYRGYECDRKDVWFIHK